MRFLISSHFFFHDSAPIIKPFHPHFYEHLSFEKKKKKNTAEAINFVLNYVKNKFAVSNLEEGVTVHDLVVENL